MNDTIINKGMRKMDIGQTMCVELLNKRFFIIIRLKDINHAVKETGGKS